MLHQFDLSYFASKCIVWLKTAIINQNATTLLSQLNISVRTNPSLLKQYNKVGFGLI